MFEKYHEFKMLRLTLSQRNYFFGFRQNLNVLFSTMCWLFCYCFLIILDTTVHHISKELEDMLLLKPICNYNYMQLCFNLKNN